MKKQSGLSISEILISLFLASLIISLLMQFYLNSKHQYLEAQELLSQNFDLRWVSDLISDSIRRAGFTPCLGIDQLAIKQSDGSVLQALKIKPQLITITRMHEDFMQVVTMQNTTQIVVSGTSSLNTKRPLLIADCEHAEILKIYSINPHLDGTLITLDKPTRFNYSASAYIGELIKEQWFIRKRSLYYRSTQTEEVTSLVHSLSIQEHKKFVEVTMGLAEGKSRTLRVLVRGL